MCYCNLHHPFEMVSCPGGNNNSNGATMTLSATTNTAICSRCSSPVNWKPSFSSSSFAQSASVLSPNESDNDANRNTPSTTTTMGAVIVTAPPSPTSTPPSEMETTATFQTDPVIPSTNTPAANTSDAADATATALAVEQILKALLAHQAQFAAREAHAINPPLSSATTNHSNDFYPNQPLPPSLPPSRTKTAKKGILKKKAAIPVKRTQSRRRQASYTTTCTAQKITHHHHHDATKVRFSLHLNETNYRHASKVDLHRSWIQPTGYRKIKLEAKKTVLYATSGPLPCVTATARMEEDAMSSSSSSAVTSTTTQHSSQCNMSSSPSTQQENGRQQLLPPPSQEEQEEEEPGASESEEVEPEEEHCFRGLETSISPEVRAMRKRWIRSTVGAVLIQQVLLQPPPQQQQAQQQGVVAPAIMTNGANHTFNDDSSASSATTDTSDASTIDPNSMMQVEEPSWQDQQQEQLRQASLEASKASRLCALLLAVTDANHVAADNAPAVTANDNTMMTTTTAAAALWNPNVHVDWTAAAAE